MQEESNEMCDAEANDDRELAGTDQPRSQILLQNAEVHIDLSALRTLISGDDICMARQYRVYEGEGEDDG